MKFITIKNRKNQTIPIDVTISKQNKGVVFVMHGLGGDKRQPHILSYCESFTDLEYTCVAFNVADTFESGGLYENASITSYYQDLEDVINWAKTQIWYKEPFFLAGHSLGGICTSLFAQKYPHQVKGIAPTSTVVSGDLLIKTYLKKDIEEWEKTGWSIRPSSSRPNLIKKLKWTQFREDAQKYNLLKNVTQLKMPVLLIVGKNDKTTPVNHQKKLLNELPGPKELHVIDNAPHTFVNKSQLVEIKKIIKEWISKYE